ncbi:MAG: LytTR family transcriptional regulator [Ruminococcus sp.]|nr:LytTR family transcriptional regulator [Ruminococcus sp.]
MKVRIEIDDSVTEDEVVIRCRSFDSNAARIQQAVTELTQQSDLSFFKDNTEYYMPIDRILFFETAQSGIDAHTADDVFTIKKKLYELEEVLPRYFMRVSKSAILNLNMVYSVEKNITASSLVRFRGSTKIVYVSRIYYKAMKQRLDERRML